MRHIVVSCLLMAVALHAKESKACEDATIEATALHWAFTNQDGNVTLTDSYNAEERMNKICGLK